MSQDILYNTKRFEKLVESNLSKLFGTKKGGFVAPCSLHDAWLGMHADRSAGHCLTGVYRSKGLTSFAEPVLVRQHLLEGLVLPPTKVNFVSYPAPEPKHKVRSVFNVPTGIIAVDRMFFKSFHSKVMTIDICTRKIQTGYSWFKPGHFRNLKQRFCKPNRVALDASFFDGSQPMWAIRVVFSAIRRRLNLTASQEKLWNALIEYYCSTPCTHGKYGFQYAWGVLSGYNWTHYLDSFLMEGWIVYLFEKFLGDTVHYGDDVLAIIIGFTAREAAEYAEGRVHLVFSPNKCSDKFDWLGLNYDEDTGELNPTDYENRFAKMQFPVKPDCDTKTYAQRVANHILAAGNGIYSAVLMAGFKELRFASTILEDLKVHMKRYMYTPLHSSIMKMTVIQAHTTLWSHLW